MSTPLPARIEAALARVRNPRVNLSLVDAAQVHDVATTPDGRVRFTLLLVELHTDHAGECCLAAREGDKCLSHRR